MLTRVEAAWFDLCNAEGSHLLHIMMIFAVDVLYTEEEQKLDHCESLSCFGTRLVIFSNDSP